MKTNTLRLTSEITFDNLQSVHIKNNGDILVHVLNSDTNNSKYNYLLEAQRGVTIISERSDIENNKTVVFEMHTNRYYITILNN